MCLYGFIIRKTFELINFFLPIDCARWRHIKYTQHLTCLSKTPTIETLQLE